VLSSRRVQTIAAGTALLVALVLLAGALRVPYVVLGPGPTFNTLGVDDQSGDPIIGIDGQTPNPTSGHLNLTTVSVSVDSISLADAIRGWFAGDQVVVPRESMYPPGQSTQQVEQRNTADFIQSQNSAEAAALCELGYPAGLGITSVDSASAAAGMLQAGDVLVSVDGGPAPDADALQQTLQAHQAGDVVPIVVSRAGAQTSYDVALIAVAGATGARIGITVAAGCYAPFSVNLGLANSIGGPSAGLMFALGITDLLGPNDLTAGAFIAGTGTIDPSGGVGAIGGIALKMIAARRAGATIFLAPADNCSTVRGNIPKGLRVIKVGTLHDAVEALLAVQRGEDTPTC
jgi:PDZ domain-containing protein